MLLVVCYICPTRIPPPSLSPSHFSSEFNLFCCAFVCKPGIAQGRDGAGGWGGDNCRFTQKSALLMAVFTAHTPKQLTRICTELWVWLPDEVCGGEKQKREELRLQFLLNVTVTPYLQELLHIFVIMQSEVWILTHVMHTHTHTCWCFLSSAPVPTWMPYHVPPCFRVWLYIPWFSEGFYVENIFLCF